MIKQKSSSKLSQLKRNGESDSARNPNQSPPSGVKAFGKGNSGIPITMSERYKRTHKYTIMKLLLNATGAASGVDGDDIASPTKTRLSQSTAAAAAVSSTTANGASSVPANNNNNNSALNTNGIGKKMGATNSLPNPDTSNEDDSQETISNLLNNNSGSSGGGGGGSGNANDGNGGNGDKSQDRDDDHGAEEVQDDVVYEPFPLKTTSSFAPGTVSARQLSRMDPRLRAKYQAYEKPGQELQEKIGASERRARKWLQDQHKRLEKVEAEDKKKWDLLHRAIEDPSKKQEGQRLALQAKQRILGKKKAFKELRVRNS